MCTVRIYPYFVLFQVEMNLVIQDSTIHRLADSDGCIELTFTRADGIIYAQDPFCYNVTNGKIIFFKVLENDCQEASHSIFIFVNSVTKRIISCKSSLQSSLNIILHSSKGLLSTGLPFNKLSGDICVRMCNCPSTQTKGPSFPCNLCTFLDSAKPNK